MIFHSCSEIGCVDYPIRAAIQAYVKRLCDQFHHSHPDFIHAALRVLHRARDVPRVLARLQEIRLVLLPHHADLLLHIHHAELQQRARHWILRMRTRRLQEEQVESEQRRRRVRRCRAFFAQRRRQKLGFDVENRGENVVENVDAPVGRSVDHFHDGVETSGDPLRARHLRVGTDQQRQKDGGDLRAVGAVAFGELIQQQRNERRIHRENVGRGVALQQHGEDRKRAARRAGVRHSRLQARLNHGEIDAFLG